MKESESDELWASIESAFFEALQLHDPEQGSFLESLEPQVSGRVRELLDNHNRAESAGFLQNTGALDAAAVGTGPEKIGVYKVLKEIGMGGMGRVFLGQRTDGQFQQRVAIKRLFSPFVSKDIVARFQTERQILANFQHPGIARLLGGGLDDENIPYLVMEFIDGHDILTYCREHNASLEARVALFLQVCEAVEYAHQHLVVHRDLKPSNIMVTKQGEVKLLDFGIAKILNPGDGFSHVIQTQDAHPMTPRYTSPEQILNEPITTACDVYSLGTLFYEILTDELPFGRDLSLVSFHYSVLEKLPSAPSSLLSRTVPKKEISRYQDLDAICLKCLRRYPKERYHSVSNLLKDLENYQKGLPIEAKGNSGFYRFQKFVQRNKALSFSTVSFLVILMFSFGVLFYQAQALKKESLRVIKEKENALAIAGFLEGLFEEADPAIALGTRATALDILSRGVLRIDQALADQPETYASVMLVLISVHLNLGAYDQVMSLIEKLQTHPDLTTAQRIDIHHYLSQVYLVKVQLKEAKKEIQAGIELARSLGMEGLRQEMKIQLTLGDLYREEKSGEAQSAYDRALEINAILEDKDGLDTLKIMGRIAEYEFENSNWEKAVSMNRNILVQKQKLMSPDHPGVGITECALGNALRKTKAFEEAEAFFLKGIANLQNNYPEGHELVATAKNDFAGLLKDMGKFDEAKREYMESIGMYIQLFGEDHPRVVMSENNYAVFLVSKSKDYKSAVPVFERVIQKAKKIMPADHPFISTVQTSYATALAYSGSIQAADSVYRELTLSLTKIVESMPGRRSTLAWILVSHGNLLMKENRIKEAYPKVQESLRLYFELAGDDHPDIGYPMFSVLKCQLELGLYQEAEPLARRALAFHQNKGADPIKVAQAKLYLGQTLLHLNKKDEAEPLLLNSFETLRQTPGMDYQCTQQNLEQLINLHLANGVTDQAHSLELLRYKGPLKQTSYYH